MKTTKHTCFSFTVIAALVLIASLTLSSCGSSGGGGGGNTNTTPNPTYTVTYDSNGSDIGIGSVPVDTTTYETGQTVTVPGNTGALAKTGYSFAGWNTQADGLGTTYGASFLMGSANVTLFAKWTANPTYTVTYDANVNTPYTPTGSVPIDTTHYEAGVTVTVSGNTGNLATNRYQDGINLTFHSWNTQADGNGTTYTPGQTFIMDTANVTLYAQWSVMRGTGPGGGLVFYDKGSYSGSPGWRYLEAAPVSTQWPDGIWAANSTLIGASVAGTAIGTGQANTTAIVTWLNTNGESGRAAQLCDDLTYGGYNDWFLPSKDELHAIHVNLHEYGVGNFGGYYWSSSEANMWDAWVEYFHGIPGAFQYAGWKNGSTYYPRTRAVRAF